MILPKKYKASTVIKSLSVLITDCQGEIYLLKENLAENSKPYYVNALPFGLFRWKVLYDPTTEFLYWDPCEDALDRAQQHLRDLESKVRVLEEFGEERVTLTVDEVDRLLSTGVLDGQ